VLVELTTDMGIADALNHLVFDPLGIEAYLGVEPMRPTVVVADVSADQDWPDIQVYNSPFSRSIPDPADDLTTTASGVISLARAFQNIPSGFLSTATHNEATRDQTASVSGGLPGILEWPRCPWGLGPMLFNPEPPPFTPSLAGPGSYGHTGYCTGYVWSSPVHDITWTILGARTYDNGWPIAHAPAIEAAILAQGSGS
jgi:CubicO group peptidase (beta-lactamase class C family)